MCFLLLFLLFFGSVFSLQAKRLAATSIYQIIYFELIETLNHNSVNQSTNWSHDSSQPYNFSGIGNASEQWHCSWEGSRRSDVTLVMLYIYLWAYWPYEGR